MSKLALLMTRCRSEGDRLTARLRARARARARAKARVRTGSRAKVSLLLYGCEQNEVRMRVRGEAVPHPTTSTLEQ